MDLHAKYPAISDLKARARRRIPHFVWEYLDSATGSESVTARNRAALDRVLFRPAALRGEIVADLATTFLGRAFPVPFGIAPLGMSGLVWPEAEILLARHAARAGIPYGLSTVATRTPEDLKGAQGDQGWFQMYPPRDPGIRDDMPGAGARARGFTRLCSTVDVPAASRRERQTRGGLVQPPRLTPRLALQVARCPCLGHGHPGLGHAAHAADGQLRRPRKKLGRLPSTAHVGYLLRAAPDWDYVAGLREAWTGPFIPQGGGFFVPMETEVATRAEAEGVDAIWVSNPRGPAVRRRARRGGCAAGDSGRRPFGVAGDLRQRDRGRARHPAHAWRWGPIFVMMGAHVALRARRVGAQGAGASARHAGQGHDLQHGADRGRAAGRAVRTSVVRDLTPHFHPGRKLPARSA